MSKDPINLVDYLMKRDFGLTANKNKQISKDQVLKKLLDMSEGTHYKDETIDLFIDMSQILVKNFAEETIDGNIGKKTVQLIKDAILVGYQICLLNKKGKLDEL